MTSPPNNMSSNSLDPSLLMKLGDALNKLPNIKPRKARALVEEGRSHIITQWMARDRATECDDGWDKYTTTIGGKVPVTGAELNGLFIKDHWDTPRITPEAAELLVRLYEAGAFELKSPKAGLSDPVALREYAAEADALRQRQLDYAEAKRAHAERLERLVANPAEVSIEEFSLTLLNAIFFKHIGPGRGSMEVGGVTVNKALARYTSNSGRNADWSVHYSWKMPDGTVHSIGKESIYADNRRNDADRNWGLPE